MSYVIVNNVRYNVNEGELVLRNIGINSISGIQGLSSLSNLIKLDLSYNNITEINGLDNLKNLRYLLLNNNKISEITGLESLTKLMVLHLEGNQIDEIKGLENLSNLNSLYLKNNNITEITGIDHLKKLKLIDLGPKDSQIRSQKVQELRSRGISTKDSWAKHKTQKEKEKMKKIYTYLIGPLVIDLIITIIIVAAINYYSPLGPINLLVAFFGVFLGLYLACLLIIYIGSNS